MEIKLLNRDQIDDKRWNGCVHFALSATPYAYTWYLDNVCETWQGLIVGNYKIVMPITRGKKFGFNYSYQPFFTQQLGVYSDLTLSKETIQEFADALPKDLSYIDICLNESNFAPKGFETIERSNYLLDLKPSYEEIKKAYSGNVLRNIRRAEKAGFYISNHLSAEEFANFYKQHTAPKVAGFNDQHYYMMLRLIYQALHFNMGILVGVYNTENVLVAANFLINHPQRLINLMPSSNEEGLKHGAMAFLLDSLIAKNSEQNKFLDFEGSMIEGIVKFYRSFGAKRVIYYQIKLNLLPKILRIFKK